MPANGEGFCAHLRSCPRHLYLISPWFVLHEPLPFAYSLLVREDTNHSGANKKAQVAKIAPALFETHCLILFLHKLHRLRSYPQQVQAAV